MNAHPPARDEAADYYFKYIDLVPAGDIREILDDQRQETLNFLSGIPQSLAGHRYGPDKWTVCEVVNHINDCERLFTMRAFWFAREMKAPLPSFEPDDAAKAARAAGRPMNAHIHEFASIRASTIDLFRNMPEEGWLRRGVASDCPFTVRALAYIAAGHVLHHTRILSERYLTAER